MENFGKCCKLVANEEESQNAIEVFNCVAFIDHTVVSY